MHGASSADASAEALKRRRADQMRELEKAKRARVEREQERESWEAEKVLLEREREQMAFVENEKREEEFQLRQMQLRAKVRAGEGRGRPIDLLSESLSLLDEDADPTFARSIKLEVRSRRGAAGGARCQVAGHMALTRGGGRRLPPLRASPSLGGALGRWCSSAIPKIPALALRDRCYPPCHPPCCPRHPAPSPLRCPLRSRQPE